MYKINYAGSQSASISFLVGIIFKQSIMNICVLLKTMLLTLISLPCIMYMPEAYVLLNCDFGADDESIVCKLKELPEIIEVNGVSGAYDLLVKVSADTMEKLKETISLRIRTIDNIKSTLSLIVIEGQG